MSTETKDFVLWYNVYDSCGKVNVGMSTDVYDLCRAIHQNEIRKLNNVDASDLRLSAAGADPYEADALVASFAAAHATKATALIVTAPGARSTRMRMLWPCVHMPMYRKALS